MNFTGADFYALCSDALLIAMKRKVVAIDKIVETQNALLSNDLNGPYHAKSHNQFHRKRFVTAKSVSAKMSVNELVAEVSNLDFEEALRLISPSLSFKDLMEYQKLQHEFSKQGVLH